MQTTEISPHVAGFAQVGVDAVKGFVNQSGLPTQDQDFLQAHLDTLGPSTRQNVFLFPADLAAAASAIGWARRRAVREGRLDGPIDETTGEAERHAALLLGNLSAAAFETEAGESSGFFLWKDTSIIPGATIDSYPVTGEQLWGKASKTTNEGVAMALGQLELPIIQHADVYEYVEAGQVDVRSPRYSAITVKYLLNPTPEDPYQLKAAAIIVQP